ncbi:hypothetical protein CORC01_00709 [Colletotrichum orchidophilum]|uniref:Uncharacterized protein n=1 Tax=Colletotrichum orchidophilum TaxID=1209926 RepID=A0A1G4BRF3_9PEZI|nr:uncharacterized protein CORC01_00709 [Colletotrichum orchidophilum]OHF03847.1 hypothetical protein CORC01_00709 [Colletotrichum orchidophilum]
MRPQEATRDSRDGQAVGGSWTRTRQRSGAQPKLLADATTIWCRAVTAESVMRRTVNS